jgi:hypothetical protein
VPQPHESQPDVPQEASPEEEPFEIELVDPESPTAQDSPAEEQQQPKDHDIEDKANEEYPPPSDAEDEKMYRDADEVECFGIKAPVLAGRLRALLEHLGITTTPRYRIKEVPHLGRVKFKAIVEIFFGSRVLCRHKGPAFRTSHNDDDADAAWQAITSIRFWLNLTLCLICLGLRGSMVFCIKKPHVLVATLLSSKLDVCHPYGLV